MLRPLLTLSLPSETELEEKQQGEGSLNASQSHTQESKYLSDFAFDALPFNFLREKNRLFNGIYSTA